MAHRKGSLSPYCFFVRDRLPELQRRGLPVTRVADAVPYCSQEWALLTKEEKMAYTQKACKWKENKCSQKTVKEIGLIMERIVMLWWRTKPRNVESCHLAHPVPASLATKMPSLTSFLDAMSWKNDQAVVADIFYFLNIYSHGKLPSHCEQRFLPCEIGCVKYSLRDGIMADFHHFIDPEVPPRGFRYHCQAASEYRWRRRMDTSSPCVQKEETWSMFSYVKYLGDATHKIPISGFQLSCTCYAVVLRELLEFVQSASGVRPRFYCRSNDRFRINWCLNRMASLTGIESHLDLLAVEDLVIELYQKKYKKEPSRTWVCRELDVFLWDFSSNTRCRWHEENDILCCALASCKKIAYCISKSLANVYGVSLTAAHLPLQDSDYGEGTNTKRVILDAGRFQKMKAEGSGCDRHFASPRHDQEFVPSNCDSPCGVKTSLYGTSTMRGRGITRLLKSASDDLSKSSSN